jgi:N6-adenosine-specific RNA methylase IME4
MKKYQIIYADPPWDVHKIIRRVRPNQVEMDYPTMSLTDIENLGIALRAYMASDCKLFLWTTHKYLPFAFGVVDAWGFKYQRTITWDKQNGMCLFGFHQRTEFLLFGYRGKIEMYPHRKAFPTIVTAKSPRHSEKPQIFRDLIAPFGEPRLELFARRKVEGWDCWGNEVESDIEFGVIGE